MCFVSPAFGFFGDRWRVNECKLDIGVAQIDMAYYLGQVRHRHAHRLSRGKHAV